MSHIYSSSPSLSLSHSLNRISSESVRSHETHPTFSPAKIHKLSVSTALLSRKITSSIRVNSTEFVGLCCVCVCVCVCKNSFICGSVCLSVCLCVCVSLCLCLNRCLRLFLSFSLDVLSKSMKETEREREREREIVCVRACVCVCVCVCEKTPVNVHAPHNTPANLNKLRAHWRNLNTVANKAFRRTIWKGRCYLARHLPSHSA